MTAALFVLLTSFSFVTAADFPEDLQGRWISGSKIQMNHEVLAGREDFRTTLSRCFEESTHGHDLQVRIEELAGRMQMNFFSYQDSDYVLRQCAIDDLNYEGSDAHWSQGSKISSEGNYQFFSLWKDNRPNGRDLKNVNLTMERFGACQIKVTHSLHQVIDNEDIFAESKTTVEYELTRRSKESCLPVKE